MCRLFRKKRAGKRERGAIPVHTMSTHLHFLLRWEVIKHWRQRWKAAISVTFDLGIHRWHNGRLAASKDRSGQPCNACFWSQCRFRPWLLSVYFYGQPLHCRAARLEIKRNKVHFAKACLKGSIPPPPQHSFALFIFQQAGNQELICCPN